MSDTTPERRAEILRDAVNGMADAGFDLTNARVGAGAAPNHEDGRPVLEIRPETVACPAHSEYLRATWPHGFPHLAKAMMDDSLGSPLLLLEIGIGPEARADSHTVIPLVNELATRKPLCYFASEQSIREAYLAAGILRPARCRMCMATRHAGIYTVAGERGPRRQTVCIECVLKIGQHMHRFYPDGRCWG